MSVVGRLRRRVAAHLRRLRSVYLLRRFVWSERPALTCLQIGLRTTVQVPLRCDGCGHLVVGSANSFGFAQAPRLGTGEILLQPREPGAVIRIGDGNWFSNNVSLIANLSIAIGNGCQIGDQVTILDSDFHETAPQSRTKGPGLTRPVTIGNNAWLGSRVMVLKGVSIGDNSVIAAMSVVNRSIPANCVAAGIPARVVREL